MGTFYKWYYILTIKYKEKLNILIALTKQNADRMRQNETGEFQEITTILGKKNSFNVQYTELVIL